MRIVCISDTHGQHGSLTLPDGDVLIHAGDFSGHSNSEETIAFLTWFSSQPHKYKILICGNHETWQAADMERFRFILNHFPNIIYLHDSIAIIEGVRFWGSPYQPRFLDWAFNVDRGDPIQKHWDKIPDNVDVLITHGPRHGVLDYNNKNQSCGCSNLASTIEYRLKNLKLHVFGHMHLQGGSWKKVGNVMYINASVVNERYWLVNKPQIYELNNE